MDHDELEPLKFASLLKASKHRQRQTGSEIKHGENRDFISISVVVCGRSAVNKNKNQHRRRADE